MIDALAAAASAVSLVMPALIEIGKGGAGKLGEEAAGKILGWLRAKTAGRAKQALTELEADPDSPGYQAVLREQLAKLLAQDPTLLSELRALLPAPSAGDTMHQHIEGPGAKGAQIKGSGNTVTM